MHLGGEGPQKSRQLELALEDRGEASKVERSVEAPTAMHDNGRSGASGLMERVCERANLQAALKRVRKNKGSAGIDGMTVDELPEYLRTHWPEIREQLLAGTYQPSPVRRHAIPKSGGGVRELGIPTVVDRFVQQAILQVLGPRFDATFSQHSYGFRRGRSAHDAVVQAQRYVNEGRRIVVDVDLERFFDRVNHDVLMGRLAKRIEDKLLLGLVRRYLEAGMMANGIAMERHEGTPQGGPLSPLLANVLLDEVDRELEKRGHAFVRYADDCNVRAAVQACWRTGDGPVAQALREAAAAGERDQERRRSYLVGWKNYFRLADTPGVFRALDEWIRHRLRALHLKHWRRGRVIYRELRHRGLSDLAARRVAANARRWWKNSAMAINLAFPIRYFDSLGIPQLVA